MWSLASKLWGRPNVPEQSTVPQGVLYEIMPPGAKVKRRCVYKDAQLSIRPTNIKHQYQLVVHKVVDEDEKKLLEDDDENEDDDERAFLIGVEIGFARTMFEAAHGFKWSDPVEPEGSGYEYIMNGKASIVDMCENFAMAVAKCAWSRKESRPYADAPAAEAKAILAQAEEDDLEQMLRNVKIDDSELAKAAENEEAATTTPAKQKSATEGEDSRSSVPAASASAAAELPAEPDVMVDGEIIVSVLGSLYLFDPQTTDFVEIAEEVALTVVKADKYTYWMNVASNERDFSSQRIEPEMNAVFNHDYRSLIWNYFDVAGKAYSFSMIPTDDAHYNALHQGMTRAAYETLNQELWENVSESAQEYMLDACEEDAEMLSLPDNWSAHSESADEEEEEEESDEGEDDFGKAIRHQPVPAGVKTSRPAERDDEDEYNSNGSDESEAEAESGESDSEDEEGSEHDGGAGDGDGNSAKNSRLAVGYKHGRSFVVRGNRIGVFKHTDDDKIEFDTTINQIDDTRGRKFTPSSMLLHEQDSALVLADSQRPHELYKMDLESGKVVEEWKVHEDVPTVTVAPTSKFSQMTGDKTLVGLSHNMLYRIDPRLGGNNLIVQSENQAYSTKSHFTSAATTETGAIAVGSAKGEIRLFDRLGVRAKTMLPALGEPIIGIDVTSDGRYVVATCKMYLLLIDTKLPEDSAGRTGFQKSFPAARKPAPRRLQLKPEHVVYMGAPISFTPAKFNQSPDGNHSEKTIVTSSGPFVITWNLRRALGKGRGDAYSIKQYPETVVADNFRFGQDKSIVVTLPNDVLSVKRSQLAKPTRKTLMIHASDAVGSSLLSSSRNDIVDSPY